jgi:hypothetical protein
MLCMYIQTQSSTNPLSKRCDVTYPNSSDYEAYYIISFSLSFSPLSLLPSVSLSLTLSLIHEAEGTKERMKEGQNVKRKKDPPV